MPVSRSYGGFQPSYSSSYYTPSYYSAGSYSTYRPSSSTYTPSSSRATTPSRSMISLIPEERKREFRSFGLTPISAPAAYKYFSRADFYNTTAIYNRSMTSNYNSSASRKELKTVKTEDLDVEREMTTKREHAIPGEIKRDTAANIAGGKQVIRLVTTNRKDNPYNLVGTKPVEELSLGQRLAMKHILVDPKEKERQEAAAALAALKAEEESSEAESEWTWETCSESEAEELEEDKPTAKKAEESKTTQKTNEKIPEKQAATSSAKTTNSYLGSTTGIQSVDYRYTSSYLSSTQNNEKRPVSSYSSSATPSQNVEAARPSSSYTSHNTEPVRPSSSYLSSTSTNVEVSKPTSSYLSSTSEPVEKKPIPTYPTWMRTTGVSYVTPTQTPSVAAATPTTPSITPSTYRRSSWLEDKTPVSTIPHQTSTKTEESSSSSSNSAGSPKFLRRYGGAGSRTILEIGDKSEDESSDEGVLNIGWRRGQPPRSDVVVKMTHDTTARVTNKILVQNSKPEVGKPASVERRISFSTPTIVPTSPTSVPTTPTTLYHPQVTSPPPTILKTPSSFFAAALEKAKKDVKLPDLKFASEGKSEVLAMSETEPLKMSTISSAPASAFGQMSMVVDNKCIVTVSIEVGEEEPQPFDDKAPTVSRQLEGTIHPDNLTYATRKEKPKLSTCSEVIEGFIEEVFETSTAMDDLKFTTEEVQTVTESHAPLIVSKVECPQVLTMEAVEMKMDEVKIEVIPEVEIAAEPTVSKDPTEVGVKAKKKKTDVEQSKGDVKPKKKANKEKGKQKKAEKDRRASTPPPPSEYRLQAPSVSTTMSTSLPSSAAKPPVITDDHKQERPMQELRDLEEAIIATQLERVPSAFRKVFELKTKGEAYAPERPREGPLPKYWNNDPKSDETKTNPFLEMAQMKNEVKKHKEKIKQEQAALLKTSEGEAEEVWYKDESSEFQEQLKAYEHQASDHRKNVNDRKTPDENVQLIRLYGGIQFPESLLDPTPPHVLRHEQGGAVQCPSEADEDAAAFSDTVVTNNLPHGGPPARQRRRSVPPSTANLYFNEPPVKTRPQFRKYGINDFFFHRVLGKGSFGKVLLAELRDGSQSFYALKCLKKDLVLEDDDIECTLIERKVLTLGCKHPFICHLFCTFQTESHLFFAMEYLNGGDLMFHIQQSSKFDLDRAKFYAAEVMLALKFLHKKGIVYRDLKLDNVLLDHEGHIRLADFGMCKLQIYLDRMTDTFCGTPDYMAPEIIKGLKYTYCVDWWSFGVLLYEMLMGQSPFNGCDEDELFWSICNEQPFYPKHLTRETKLLLTLLLDKDPARRLGVKGCCSGDICDQPFFKGVNFDLLEKKQIIPPFRPQLRHPLDVSNFESAFTADEPLLTPVDQTFLDTVNQIQFKGFSYTNPNYTLQ